MSDSPGPSACDQSDTTTASDTPPARINVLIFFFIALLAFAIRLAFLLQARGVVFFDHLVGDAATYDAWARRILAGDFWGRAEGVFYQAPLYPYFLAFVEAFTGHDFLRIRIVQIAIGALTCG